MNEELIFVVDEIILSLIENLIDPDKSEFLELILFLISSVLNSFLSDKKYSSLKTNKFFS